MSVCCLHRYKNGGVLLTPPLVCFCILHLEFHFLKYVYIKAQQRTFNFWEVFSRNLMILRFCNPWRGWHIVLDWVQGAEDLCQWCEQLTSLRHSGLVSQVSLWLHHYYHIWNKQKLEKWFKNIERFLHALLLLISHQ